MREREVIAKLKKFHRAGEPLDTSLQFLRTQGVTKIGSIRLLHLALGTDLREAKIAVFQSSTWKDRFERDEKFLDELLQDVSPLGRSKAAA